MKKSTMVLTLLAVVLGAFVYFYEVKHGKPRDEAVETTKQAFAFKREDIAGLTLTRAGETVVIESYEGKWVLKQPVSSAADESAVGAILSDLTSSRIERNLAATAEELKSFGLANPTVTLEIKLRSGEKHRVQLGSKDFSGLSVYGQLDQAKDAVLLPASLLTSTDKSLDDLRDRSVVGISQYDLGSLTLTNENGRLVLVKQDANWLIKSPVEGLAEEAEVTSLVNEISSAKASGFVSEAPESLAKYGLDKPKIVLSAQLKSGGERTLSIGSKTEDRYFAKSSERSQVFKVESSLYTKLNAKLFDLRDKRVVKLDKEELTRLQVKNPNGTLVAEKDKDSKWITKEPADKKDKEVQSWRIFDPLETNKATEIMERASTSIVAKLRKPAVEVRLTRKDGKTTTVMISIADGDSAYVRVDGRAEVFKVSKQLLEGLSFKVSDVIL